MIKFFIVFAIVLCSFFLSAQEVYYTPPLKIPMLLSGSFGELRSNHFHSGIDIKTQGKINAPVYSVAEGYISRISISPTGYGNVIYINHDNGTTSVYGHLNQFRPDISDYIKNIQYENKSFRVDVPVLPGVLTLQKDEKFALSGNSGSSQGPHLHFELRNTRSENPINPLKLGFLIKDTTPPKIFALQISPLSKSSHVNHLGEKVIYNVAIKNGKYQLTNNDTIQVYGELGFAIESNDYFDGTHNKCGIVSMELTIDDVVYSIFEINRFSFNESRKINSYIDYEEYAKSKRRFQRTWIEPCNPLSNFYFSENNGIFDPGIGSFHKVKIEILDASKNNAVLEFTIESKYREMNVSEDEFNSLFVCGQSNQMSSKEFKINLPKDALYKDLEFKYESNEAKNGYFSAIHEIHNNTVPLNKKAAVSIKAKNLIDSLQNKALLVKIDDETGKYSAAGGKFENGWINANISSFGNYAVRIDTVPPEIKPLSISNRNTLTEKDRIRFKISDDLAGIDKIEGLIDGKWALFEYDAKNNKITHYFDATRFELNKQHQFKLTVTDYTGNSSIYEATFNK